MVTTVSHVPNSASVKEDRPAIDVATELKKQDNSIVSRRQIWKGFEVLSTLLIGAAALAPNVFGIPMGLRPWVFLTSIFWYIAFCAGMFNP